MSLLLFTTFTSNYFYSHVCTKPTNPMLSWKQTKDVYSGNPKADIQDKRASNYSLTGH